jgi:hypothetical protein
MLPQAQYNWYLNGAQYSPLTGLLSGANQYSDVARFLRGFVFPQNHLTNMDSAMDDTSVADILQPSTSSATYGGSNWLNVLAFKFGGMKWEDLMFQINAYNNTYVDADTPRNLPALNIWVQGLVNKVGVLRADGDFEVAFV